MYVVELLLEVDFKIDLEPVIVEIVQSKDCDLKFIKGFLALNKIAKHPEFAQNLIRAYAYIALLFLEELPEDVRLFEEIYDIKVSWRYYAEIFASKTRKRSNE